MSGYETLDGFKKKLKNGGYDNATGARRAIGKMSTWEEADKDAARKAVDRHFGDAAPAAAAKKAAPAAAAPKTGKAKRPLQRKKKAAKKVAAKAAPAPEKKAAAPAPARQEPAPAKKAPRKKTAAAKPPQETTQTPDGVIQTKLRQYGETLELYRGYTAVLKGCESEGISVVEGLKSVSTAVSALLIGLDADVVAPLTRNTAGEDARAAELFASVAPEPVGVPQRAATNGAAEYTTPVMPPVIPPSAQA
jgi:hypothetical protein